MLSLNFRDVRKLISLRHNSSGGTPTGQLSTESFSSHLDLGGVSDPIFLICTPIRLFLVLASVLIAPKVHGGAAGYTKAIDWRGSASCLFLDVVRSLRTQQLLTASEKGLCT